MATEKGDYLTLEKPTIMGWRTVNINTKETKDMELVKDMAEMRYIGKLDSQTDAGINIVNDDNQKRFSSQHRSIITRRASTW